MCNGSSSGVESRLATLTIDEDDLQKLLGISSRLATRTLDKDDHEKLSRIISRFDVPSTIQLGDVSQLATTPLVIFNSLNIRRAIIPATNGHCSARALARYYAALADGGMVPWPHSSSSKPPLGSHPHIPYFLPKRPARGRKVAKPRRTNDYEKKPNYSDVISHGRNSSNDSCTRLVNDSGNSNSVSMIDSSEDSNHRNNSVGRIFGNPRIHDAFLGVGEYGNLALPNGKFGLGFRRSICKDGSIVGFGHSGLGGSTSFSDMNNRFAIAVTLNKMSFGAVTGSIINFVCLEFNIPVPEEFSIFSKVGPNAQICLGRLLNN
ncbi:hypothetical protein SO802_011145 [Lithocarpus litseifolius]|uniref:Beta-lactamase-related domain-containing protein n=1 Tax=Lithocarpus litseifolius TaxID=425828 RepID=A0AAW2DIU0_9ROSI